MPSSLPSKKQILSYIRGNSGAVGRRELARAFGIKGPLRAELRGLLEEMREEGLIERGHKRRMTVTGELPPVTVIEITHTDSDGDVYARPAAGPQTNTSPGAFSILLSPNHRKGIAPKVGDRVLARLTRIDAEQYEARAIRLLPPGPIRMLGVLEAGKRGCLLRTVDRKSRDGFVATSDLNGAKAGDFVEVETAPGSKRGRNRTKTFRVLKVLGDGHGPKAFSCIALHRHGIPHEFSPETLREAEGLTAFAKMTKGRTDLRSLPLVTIDGEDARDFDDAVWAAPDKAPANKGGWRLLVAIADVAHYVRPGSALDRTARERGNSVYFPDQVVPMLPEQLSNDLCSLRPGVDRPCLAVDMTISADGQLLHHSFQRGIMRSAARLTYQQVQAAQDGYPDDTTGPLLKTVLTPLYGAWAALDRARKKRHTLELDIPERKVILNEDGNAVAIVPHVRLDSHRLIEEFMITANVAAAETLEKRRAPVMYRIHEPPDMAKLEALRESLSGLGYKLTRGHVIKPQLFTGLLAQAAREGKGPLVSSLVLRSQSQAVYGPENAGHFGLALRRYAHFTSPIRRYADLLVHRALIATGNLGKGGLSDREAAHFAEIGEAISLTERRAVVAEREVMDRYTAAFLAEQTGAEFSARINGATRAGLFITLDETGADGLIPMRRLPRDYYVHDEVTHSLTGRETGLQFSMGDAVSARLEEVNPLAGSLIFSLTAGGKVGKKPKRPAPRKKNLRRKGGKRRKRGQ